MLIQQICWHTYEGDCAVLDIDNIDIDNIDIDDKIQPLPHEAYRLRDRKATCYDRA